MIEFNPGHLDSLRKLGILGAEETAISPQELAERVVQSDKLVDALNEIRQEASNAMMSFDLISQTLDDIEDTLPDLMSKTQVEQELEGLNEEFSQLGIVLKRLEGISLFFDLFDQLTTAPNVTLSSTAKQHLTAIKSTFDKLTSNFPEIVASRIEQGQRLVAILQQKQRELGNE